MENDHLTPHVFTRHNLHLHALLLENQPWFSARDLGRFLRLYLDERAVRKLDPDQRQYRQVLHHGTTERTLLISESGVYALLIYHYCPEYRSLREWLTHDIVPTLRDAHGSGPVDQPNTWMLDWPEMSLILLHWNNQAWIRVQDMPRMLLDRSKKQNVRYSLWRKWTAIFGSFKTS